MLDLRYMAQASKTKELVESGVIGDVKLATFTGQHGLSFDSRPRWYFEDGKHGGTINDIAIHGLDLVRFITGKNLTKIDCAKTWNAYAVKAPNFKDCGQFMVDMEGMAVTADVSYSAPRFKGILPTYWDFYFWGLNGMIHFNLTENKTCLYKDGTCETFECEFFKSTYLDDLPKMIAGVPTLLNTKDILESQRQVLMIQKAAE
jgi:predicted dehydrogenase